MAELTLHLTIDQLTLDGFSDQDSPRIVAALQAELERLLRLNGVPPHLQRGRAIGDIDTDQLNITPADTPEQAGQRIAQAIYAGLV